MTARGLNRTEAPDDARRPDRRVAGTELTPGERQRLEASLSPPPEVPGNDHRSRIARRP
ncbi:MAG: hypothetical protein R3F11_07130 [Verrucomicrobiales bacterium]